MSKSVSILGGGLAGISSAVFLHDAGYEVKLFESTSKLGGRTFSFDDAETGFRFDNGQHILAGWYKNTFQLFDKMNHIPDLSLHQNLHVYFRDKNGSNLEFIAKGDNPFVAAAKGFMNYQPLNLKDKLSLLRLRELIEIDFPEKIKGRKLSWLLNYLKQTDNLIKYFWEPFVFAVFNTSPEYVDSELFYNVLATAFDDPAANTLIIPNDYLDNMIAKPFIEYSKNKISINYNSAVNEFKIKDNRIMECILENGEIIKSDLYVSAVPFHSFRRLFNTDIFEDHFDSFIDLKPASILSVFLVPDKMPVNLKHKYYFGMVGILDGLMHWVFFKENYISVTISAPEYTVNGFEELSKEDVCVRVEKEIRDYFPEFRDTHFKKVKYFREKRATFLPETNSVNSRLNTVCEIKNLFIAGDWTNTGLPSTIESAVLSGKKCMEAIVKI
ncbi:MAG: oleate hydratase [Candidatus Kapaibacterium sp.]